MPELKHQSPNRNIALDIAKIVLALLVICLHGNIFYETNAALSYVLVNGLCRLAVPIFFVINGYYFARIDTKEKFIAWGKRILTLYLFWSIFYLLWWGYDDITQPLTLLIHILERGITGWHQLWYILALAEAGLLLFLLRNKQRLGTILALSLFLLGTAMNYLSSSGIVSIVNSFYRNGLIFGFPMCYIGYLINKRNITLKIHPLWQILLASLCILLVLTESYNNYIMQYYRGYDMLLSQIIACPILFIIILNIKINGTTRKLALLSTALFLIHPLWQTCLNDILHYSVTFHMNSITHTLITIILSLLSSFILIKINDKYKFIL